MWDEVKEVLLYKMEVHSPYTVAALSRKPKGVRGRWGWRAVSFFRWRGVGAATCEDEKKMGRGGERREKGVGWVRIF